jgi:ABC-2 type transport system ATP-binding protein
LIQINNLEFYYEKHKNIFQDFNLTIKSQRTGIIGVNGAGKSTFIKLCVGLLQPKNGDIKINGSDIQTHRDDVLRTVGVLFENPTFPSWIKIFDYLHWVGRLRRLSDKEAISQTNFLIEKFGLSDKKYDYVSTLSAGLKQRFGIAQAIIGIPKLILLDEPTANLDLNSRYTVLEMIKEINIKNKAKFVILSHVLTDLEKYCDEVIILHQGLIKLQQSTIDFLDSYKNKLYLIKSNSPQTIDRIGRENYEQFKILKKTPMELEIKLNSNLDEIDLKNILPFDDIGIIPKWSKLEEYFYQVTNE